MIHSENRFTGAAGRSIYYQCWEPESSPRAQILLVHGLGEHSGRYQSLAGYFVGHDYAVAALDHSGHGCSEGKPGYIDKFDEYIDDLAKISSIMAARHPGLPKILLGHSMGGLIGARYLLQAQQDFVGAALSGVATRPVGRPGPMLSRLVHLLAVLLPGLGLKKLDPGDVSRDPEEVRKYAEDPLVFHGTLSARLLREFFLAIDKLEEGASGLALPLLILHGGADAMVSPRGSRLLYEQAGSIDKTLKIYPGLYHEIFNEPERESVLDEIRHWCEAHLAAGKGPTG